MNKKLSHSQINTYMTCGKKYDYHYNHRLREQVTSAALLFGTALDSTLNAMLIDLKTKELKPLQWYIAKVQSNWIKQKINDSWVELQTSLQIAYAESDCDLELLSDLDREIIYQILQVKDVDSTYESLSPQKKMIGIENMPENQARFINLVNWYSMLRKGELMVKTYYEQVLPKIKEVVDVQLKIELNNEEGDSVVGYIDAILDLGDGPRIVDNKTAARAYEEDAANVSPQLAVYGHAKGITKTAFIVLCKQIKKNRTKICSKCGNDGSGGRAKTCDKGEGKARCHGEWKETLSPEATVEVLFGDINPIFEDHVLENYEHTLNGINNKVFSRNFNNCLAYGRKCPYFELCHEGTGEDKLIKV